MSDDKIRIRTLDGREHTITQAQWDQIYRGDGSTIVEAYKPANPPADTDNSTPNSADPTDNSTADDADEQPDPKTSRGR